MRIELNESFEYDCTEYDTVHIGQICVQVETLDVTCDILRVAGRRTSLRETSPDYHGAATAVIQAVFTDEDETERWLRKAQAVIRAQLLPFKR